MQPQGNGQPSSGWYALHRVWGLTCTDLDDAVLSCLAKKQPYQQEQILLSFASIDLSNVCNLSAYLNSLINDHDHTNQV